MSTITLVIASIIGQLGVGSASPAVFAEAEIERGKEISRLTVYLVNESKNELVLATGALGARVRNDGEVGGGTGIVVPRLMFVYKPNSTWLVEIAAPSRISDPSRDMKPQIFVLPAASRKRYYSFFVPSPYVAGDYVSGTVPTFKDKVQVEWMIVRLLEKGDLDSFRVPDVQPWASTPELEQELLSQVYGEVEIDAGPQVSSVSIFVRNNRDRDISTGTGAKGADETDEGVGGGSGITAIPAISFDTAGGIFAFWAPVFKSPQQGTQEELLRLPSKERLLYCSFLVPTVYLAGGRGFQGGSIRTSHIYIPISKFVNLNKAR